MRPLPLLPRRPLSLLRRALPLLALTAALPALAQWSGDGDRGPQYRGLRSEGMGRTGVASSAGSEALFLNPAGLGRERRPFTLGLETSAGINEALFDYARWAADNHQHLDQFDTLLQKIEPVNGKWAPFAQHFGLGGSYRDYSLALVWDLRYDVAVSKAVVTAVPGVGALSDMTAMAGRSYAIRPGYTLGVAFKYLYRLRYESRLIGTTDEDLYRVKSEWEKPADGVFDNLRKLTVASEVAEEVQGAGMNLGLLREIDANWRAGIALLDFPTFLDAEAVKPEVNLGLTYHHGFGLGSDMKAEASYNAEWQHFLVPGVPWFKQAKVGAAFEAWQGRFPVAYLAAGLNDGYPTFGAKVGYVLYLSYTYYAEEDGSEAGQKKLSFHKLLLEMRI